MNPKPRKLNPRQQVFIKEYLVDMNASRAAIRAGYAPSTAGKKAPLWVGKSRDKSPFPEIWDAVQMALSDRMKRIGVDAAWVLAEQVRVYHRCMAQEPVLNRSGNPTGEWKFDSSGALRALELIGKHVQVGAFTKETNDDGLPVDLNWKVTVVHCSKDELEKK